MNSKNNELVNCCGMDVSHGKTMKPTGRRMFAAMLSVQVAPLARFYWTGHHVPAFYCDILIGAQYCWFSANNYRNIHSEFQLFALTSKIFITLRRLALFASIGEKNRRGGATSIANHVGMQHQ